MPFPPEIMDLILLASPYKVHVFRSLFAQVKALTNIEPRQMVLYGGQGHHMFGEQIKVTFDGQI